MFTDDRYPVSIVALGGLGKIGMNCMLIGHRDRWVMVDCGVQFPPATLIGAERMLPDLGIIEEMADKIEAVLITHGHEDHIGALPWVLPKLARDIPIFATPLTIQLIRRRLDEYKGWREGMVTQIAPRESFDAGPFNVLPVRVTHSLPDCVSLALRCEDATIVHTGDWKIDEVPMDGDLFDREAFAALGDEGVDVLLSDSTNILSPGRTLGERSVADELHRRIEAWDGRVIVTLFSSNLHRVQGLAEAARATGRKVALIGRSLNGYLDAAARVGRRPLPQDLMMPYDAIGRTRASETLLLCTGSQGEGRSALPRAAQGRHDHLKLTRDDLVLHSARIIPGNESSVYEMYNDLARRGATLVTGRGTGIHASGHARQGELEELIELLRPSHFVPVHGEYTFLKAHASLAETIGVDTTVISNGEALGVRRRGKTAEVDRIAIEPLEMHYNDGRATGDEDEMRLRERKRIAWNGLVVVQLSLSKVKSGWTATAAVETRAMWSDGDTLGRTLVRVAETAVGNCPAATPKTELEAAVAASVRAACRRVTDKRPEVIVMSAEAAA